MEVILGYFWCLEQFPLQACRLPRHCGPTTVGYGAHSKCAESAVTDLAKRHNGTPGGQGKELFVIKAGLFGA